MSLALGVNDRGFALANRNLALASAVGHAQSKNNRAEENQDFFHGDATRVYPLNPITCTDRVTGQLVRKSHTSHNYASREDRKMSCIKPFSAAPTMVSADLNKHGTLAAEISFWPDSSVAARAR